MSVFRIFVEKKPDYAVEAGHVLADAKTALRLEGLKSVRLINRYDVEGLSEADFKLAGVNVYCTYNYEGGWRNRNFRYTNVSKGINTWVPDAKKPDLRRIDANPNFAMIYDTPNLTITQSGKFPHQRKPNVLYWDLSVIHQTPTPNYDSVPPPWKWGWNELYRGDSYDYQ